MNNCYVIREKADEYNKYNAGSKARADIEAIAEQNGYTVLDFFFPEITKREKSGIVKSLYYHFSISNKWKKAVDKFPSKSTVLFQFPIKAHSILLGFVLKHAKKRGLKTIALIHDMDYLRNAIFYQNNKKKSLRLKYEEVFSIKQFSHIIAHNDKMKDYICREFHIISEKVSTLDIFDYLIPQYGNTDEARIGNAVCIAGNLDKDKSGYIYKLPPKVLFSLYGVNYQETPAENVNYQGAFLPEELPFQLTGKYGLVWDGEETDRCAGVFGEYLKYNNPHKTSLYLACGIPVIVWAEAAIAAFIQKHGCGVIINSLEELENKIASVNDQEYMILKENAIKIGRRLRNGEFTKKQLELIAEKE